MSELRQSVAPSSARSTWRAVAIPVEHGGWSLTVEPVVLGLLVAWSWSGLALGLAGLIGFLARTPLKLVAVDLRRGRWMARTRVALSVGVSELLLIAGFGSFALAATDQPFWPPLIAAAPLIALELWYDVRSRSRHLVPELAGAIAIGSLAAAVALSGGAPTKVAWGLWVVMGARSVAAIPYVRTQVLRLKGRSAPLLTSDGAQAVALVGATVGWVAGLVPAAAVFAVLGLCVVDVVAVRLRPRPAVIVGLQQVAVAVCVIGVTALAVNAA